MRTVLARTLAAWVLFPPALVVAQSDTTSGEIAHVVQGPITRGREALAQRASIELRSVPLWEALARLHESSGVNLLYNPGIIPGHLYVSCDCREATVGQALKQLLAGTSLRHVVVGGHVILEPVPTPSPELSPALLRSVALQSDSRIFTPPLPQEPVVGGLVVDERSGQPLASAQVEVVGTGLGALTDAQGRFRIERVRGAEVEVRVTIIGYVTATRTVRAGNTSIRFALVQRALDLDAIVVTGTPGATEKRSVGTAISRLDASTIGEVAPIQSVSQLITGRAAGALVRVGTGAIGGGSRITLRGAATLGLTDQPLVYVDGIRVDNTVGAGVANEGAGSPNAAISRINDFSPEEIESIEIIKGPAASTLYGTEAANGVIQIITKKGRRGGELRWDLGIRQGATWFQNPDDRFNFIYGRNASGEVFTINPVQLARKQGEDPFKTGYLQGYSLSLSGGTEVLQYFVGGEIDRDRGTDRTQALEQYRGRFNFTVTPSEKFQLNAALGYLSGRTDTPNDGGFGGPIWAFHNVRPSLLDTPRRGWLFGSPTEWYRGWDYFQEVSRTAAGIQIQHRPTRWFDHRLVLGADLVREDSHQISERMPPDLVLAFGNSLGQGRRRIDSREASNTTLDWSGSVDFPLGDQVRLTTSAGFQYYHKVESLVSAEGRAFPAAGLQTVSATAIRDAASSSIENNTVGVFVQQQVALNDRVYLTGAVRADDNSAFGKNFDMVYYPKASATWVISDEPFWNVDALSTVRLRAAYGESGQQPDVFDALRTFNPVTGGGGVPAVTPANIGNADLKPERGREVELGFDASLFDERLGIEFTYYDQKTTDAIVASTLPPSGGFGGVQFVNLGELWNRGLELLFNVNAYRSDDTDLLLTFNFATNKNEVVHVGNSSGFISLAGAQRHQEGYPVAAFFSKRVIEARMNPETGLAEDILCDDGQGSGIGCDIAPEVYVGRSLPTVFGSFSPTLTLFQRLKLYALVDFQLGHRRQDTELAGQCNADTCEADFLPERYDPTYVASQQLRLTNDYGLQDADFAKLREISATYTLPSPLAARIGARSASISVAARHLYTWTKFEGLDPEPLRLSQTYNVNNFSIVPPLASFVTRINLSF